jgi:hypothetical protein
MDGIIMITKKLLSVINELFPDLYDRCLDIKLLAEYCTYVIDNFRTDASNNSHNDISSNLPVPHHHLIDTVISKDDLLLLNHILRFILFAFKYKINIIEDGNMISSNRLIRLFMDKRDSYYKDHIDKLVSMKDDRNNKIDTSLYVKYCSTFATNIQELDILISTLRNRIAKGAIDGNISPLNYVIIYLPDDEFNVEDRILRLRNVNILNSYG